MRSSHSLDRLSVQFDDDRLLANAGLLLPATLAQHLELAELFDTHVDLGDAPGRANVGIKAMALIHSALAGGDCIDDAAGLASASTGMVLGHELRSVSSLGIFLRSFSFGDVRSLDRVSRVALARAWGAGALPKGDTLTIDVDSSICQTYGLKKQGGSRFTHTHVRGYHPLVAVPLPRARSCTPACAAGRPTPGGGLLEAPERDRARDLAHLRPHPRAGGRGGGGRGRASPYGATGRRGRPAEGQMRGRRPAAGGGRRGTAPGRPRGPRQQARAGATCAGARARRCGPSTSPWAWSDPRVRGGPLGGSFEPAAGHCLAAGCRQAVRSGAAPAGPAGIA